MNKEYLSPLQRSIHLGTAKAYTGGNIPKGWALCCPFCEWWKMRRGKLSELPGFYCGGGMGVLKPKCGKFLSKLEASSHKALYIVEE